jgi:hypothetical protein
MHYFNAPEKKLFGVSGKNLFDVVVVLGVSLDSLGLPVIGSSRTQLDNWVG